MTEPYSTVERAKINSDGTLGKWVLEADTLLVPIYGAAAVCKNGYIYVIGGDVYPYQPTTIVQYTQANPDGSLQPWQQTSSMLQQRVNHAAVECQGYIYVMDGNPWKAALNSVGYAQINPDGTLGEWAYTSSNQLGRWIPSAQAYNGYVYVLGGYASGPTATVEYASINPDGSLGEWSYTSPMTVLSSGALGTAVLNGYLYAFAGDNEPNVHNTVEKAFINPDGTLGAWSLESDILLDRVNHTGCAQSNRHVYLTGGYDIEATSDDVQMAGVYYLIAGDCNCDGVVDIGDVVYLISYLFRNGPPPGCL